MLGQLGRVLDLVPVGVLKLADRVSESGDQVRDLLQLGHDRVGLDSRAASRLNHPNSIQGIDFGKDDNGVLYMAIEFLEGKDLKALSSSFADDPEAFKKFLEQFGESVVTDVGDEVDRIENRLREAMPKASLIALEPD